MVKTKLEQLGEQIMHEIQDDKQIEPHVVTKEMLSDKIDKILELLASVEDHA